MRGKDRTALRALALWGGSGDRGRKHSATIGLRFDIKAATKLLESLADARESDANVSCFPETVKHLSRNPGTEVLHSKHNNYIVRSHRYTYGATARVPVDIGERLLQDPEQRNLGSARKPAQLRRQVKLGSDPAALAKAVDIPLRCTNEACLIEQRRMKKVRKRARVGDRSIYQ